MKIIASLNEKLFVLGWRSPFYLPVRKCGGTIFVVMKPMEVNKINKAILFCVGHLLSSSKKGIVQGGETTPLAGQSNGKSYLPLPKKKMSEGS